MRVFAAGILVTVAVLAVASQLAVPAFYEHRVQSRLEEKGGTAEVSVTAFPAVTLIAGSGEEVEVTGHGLGFDLGERRERPFERLDGFERVDVDLRALDAGSLRVERFRLVRHGRGARYALAVRGSATPNDLAREIGTTAGGPLGGLIGSLAGGLIPGGESLRVPLELRAQLRSADGRTEVAGASGSVAGLPTGPLAEVVLSAVLERL